MRQELLSSRQVAHRLGVSEEMVRYWRHIETGPAYQRVGGFHVYCTEDVDAWAREHRGPNGLLGTEEVARRLGVTRETLRLWRNAGKGPAYRKVGGLYKYRAEDVEAWAHEQGRRYEPTAQSGPPE